MVLTEESGEIVFDAGHVATASGRIFYCHPNYGICMISDVALNQSYVAQIYLKPLKQKSLRVDNFRRLDFAEFTKLGFNVDFIITADDGTQYSLPKPWSTPADTTEDDISAVVESLSHLSGYEDELSYDDDYDADNDDPTYQPETSNHSLLSSLASRHTEQSNTYICKQCGRGFSAQQKLSAHMKVHGGSKTFQCELCTGRAFSWKSDLNKHYKKHHTMEEKALLASNPSQPYGCEICGFRAAKESHLILHQRIQKHGNPRPPHPKYTPRAQTSTYDLNESCDTNGDRSCRRCGQTFQSLKQLSKHRREVHLKDKEPRHHCDHCPFKTNIRDKFREHLVKEHNVNPVPEIIGADQEPYKCIPCNISTGNYRRISRHLRTKHSGEPVECIWWGEKVTRKMTGRKCPFCSLVVNNKLKLTTHMRTHNGERPYPCDVCSKRFKYPQDKLRHLITHQEKNFSCNQCDRSFRTAKTLETHKIVLHRKEGTNSNGQLSACDKCGEIVRDIQYHRMSQHGDGGEWPKCNFCEFRHALSVVVQKHTIAKHTFNWPFRCDICNFGCFGRNEFNQHSSEHKSAKTMPLRDEQGRIVMEAQKDNDDHSFSAETGLSLLDAAASNEIEPSDQPSVNPNSSSSGVVRYDAELVRGALKAVVNKSMRMVDIVQIYGIHKRLLYDLRGKFEHLKSQFPVLSVDDICQLIEPPIRVQRVSERYPQSLIDEALNDIKIGKLTTAEASTIYGIPRPTMAKLREKAKIIDQKREQQLKGIESRKESSGENRKRNNVPNVSKEHFLEALKIFIGKTMKVEEVVKKYGIAKQTLYDHKKKLDEIRNAHPEFTENEVYEKLEIPKLRRKGSIEESFPTEIIEDALIDIKQGKLTTSEAADLYEIPRNTLISARKNRGIIDRKSGEMPKLKRKPTVSPPAPYGIKVFKVPSSGSNISSVVPGVTANISLKPEIFICKCGKAFQESGELAIHQITHSLIVFGCTKCEFKSKTKTELDIHTSTHDDSIIIETVDIS